MRCFKCCSLATFGPRPRWGRGVGWAALVLLAAGGCGPVGQTQSNFVDGKPQTAGIASSVTVKPAVPDRPADANTEGKLPDGPLSSDDLRRLLGEGQFDRFVAAALQRESADAADCERQLLRVEALLSVGRAAEAELTAAGALRILATRTPADLPLAERVVKLWATARLRQARPLEPAISSLLAESPRRDQLAKSLQTWRGELGEREPYRAAGADRTAQLPLLEHTAWTGLVSHELEAISIEANDVPLPIVFIDTGAQHTLISTAAAQAAGLEIGEAGSQLVGFATTQARPAVIKRLRLGSLTLLDVPVLVGDSAGLTIAKGQAALGIDLLHHVRLTIDYPARQVVAELYPLHEPAAPDSDSVWSIPVWTFSQACLAQGRLTEGPFARVLIDTGNRVGTFVSPRWMRRSVPEFRRPQAPIVPWIKNRNFHIAPLQLAGQTLADWPVFDTLPDELERLDLVDVLIGHDLLWQYQVTIDLRQRLFRLRNSRLPPPESESE